MSESTSKMSEVDRAIARIASSGVPVHKQVYGFSISHSELAGSSDSFAECGLDNDYSISMSVHVGEDPSVAWFFRFDFCEMASFIIESYRRAGPNPSREVIISMMRVVDTEYDHDELEARLHKLEMEFDKDFGVTHMNEQVLLSGFSNAILIDLRYQINPDDYTKSIIELEAQSRTGKRRKLKFEQISNLNVESGFSGNLTGMLIVDITNRQWDGLRIEVQNYEQDPGITFLAQNMEVLVDEFHI